MKRQGVASLWFFVGLVIPTAGHAYSPGPAPGDRYRIADIDVSVRVAGLARVDAEVLERAMAEEAAKVLGETPPYSHIVHPIETLPEHLPNETVAIIIFADFHDNSVVALWKDVLQAGIHYPSFPSESYGLEVVVRRGLFDAGASLDSDLLGAIRRLMAQVYLNPRG